MKNKLKSFAAAGLTIVLAAGVSAQTQDAPKEPTKISGKSSAKRNGAKVSIAAPADPASGEEPVLRMQFRAAPLESVLSYLSEAAGYTIILKTPLRGTVDVWNDAPLSKPEALGVLNIALAKNGLAAIVDGRKLTIVTQADAKNGNIPIRSGSKPDDIPNNDEIVTQIMPLSHINAPQLIRDLQSLLPRTADVTSNEAGNVVIITDTQANIRHFAEIVEAIDTSMSSIAGIKVFPLKYADSKALASVVKDLFAPDTSSSGRNGGSPFGGLTSRFGGGGGAPGGFGGFGGGAPGGFGGGVPTAGGTTGGSAGRTPTAARVIAVSDDRSNSLVVTAPEDMMLTIEQLVKAVDVSVEDLTEVRVFRLKYSDPTEMTDLLSNLFPDDTKSNNGNNNNTSRFGSPFGTFGGFGGGPGGPGGGGQGGGGGGGGSGAGSSSDRAKKMARVIAVPDPRTVSVVVTTSHDLMRQVEQMITQLDSAKGKNQVVKVYSLDNADPLTVQQVLQDLFPSQNKSNSRNTANLTSALSSRATTQVQSQGTGNTGFGSTGGGGRAGGGAGGGGAIP